MFSPFLWTAMVMEKLHRFKVNNTPNRKTSIKTKEIINKWKESNNQIKQMKLLLPLQEVVYRKLVMRTLVTWHYLDKPLTRKKQHSGQKQLI